MLQDALDARAAYEVAADAQDGPVGAIDAPRERLAALMEAAPVFHRVQAPVLWAMLDSMVE